MAEKDRHDALKKAVVVHVITKLELGGAQENTLINCERIGEDFDVYLVSGDGGILNDRAAEILGERFIILPTLVREIRPVKDALALASLISILRRIKREAGGIPVFVHTHSSKAGILGRIAGWISGCDFIIHTVHGFGFTPLQPRAVRGLFVFLEKAVGRITDRFVLVSTENGKTGMALGIFDGKKTRLIRSGFDVERFKAASRAKGLEILGVEEDRFTVGMVACFKPQKSPLDFVRAASLLKKRGYDFRYVMVGDGELRAGITEQIVKEGLGKDFILTGWVDEVEHVMASFDVLVLTSLWEGLPKVLPQAIVMGLPVVATRIDGNQEIVKEGVTGYLVNVHSPEEVADGIEKVYRGELEKDSFNEERRRVEIEFSDDEMVRKHRELYEQLLGETG